MVFSNDWAVADNPADHSKFKDQPSFVRKVRTDLEERFATFFYGFTAGETTAGVKMLNFTDQGADPAAPSTGNIRLYSKTVSTKSEFHLRHESAGVIQLTSLGKILLSALVSASQAVGDIWYASSATVMSRLAGNTTTTKKFLNQTGDGVNSAAPAWSAIVASDLPIASPIASARNLKIVRDSASQITATADQVVVQDTSFNSALITSFNKSAAITTSGAGGLDTGAEASSTWYYAWAIRKSSDGTTNLLLSTSSTAPTMPSGYDQKALIGIVRNDGSSNFVPFTQTGTKYNYTAWLTGASGNVGIVSWTSIDITSMVPANLSTYVYGSFGGSASAITNDSSVTADTSTPQPNKFQHDAAAADVMRFELDVITANTIYWMGNAAGSRVYIHGFEINKL